MQKRYFSINIKPATWERFNTVSYRLTQLNEGHKVSQDELINDLLELCEIEIEKEEGKRAKDQMEKEMENIGEDYD